MVRPRRAHLPRPPPRGRLIRTTDERPPTDRSTGPTDHHQHPPLQGAAMSRVRVHNFSVPLDGFATGEGQALDTPFGHAGHRLHEWMMATRFAHQEVLGEPGGSE